jgi:L-threonylcarbamoyladenylate synthase
MKIVSECNLAQLVVDLTNGKTVVFPTETTYGLGCDATNKSAVEKIFAIKGRRPDKPLLVVVPTIAMAKKYLAWSPLLEQLAQKYWPGPLTIIGEYQKSSPDLVPGVVGADNTVAVRVTAFDLTKSISEKLDRPLVATSANLSDTGELYAADAIAAQFADREQQPDLILNQGVLPKRPPTTIVRVYSDRFEVLRQGDVVVSL